MHVLVFMHMHRVLGGTTCLANAGFDPNQAYQGDIADVIILDHLVTLQEVQRLSCAS